MSYMPTLVNGLVTDHNSVRLSVEGFPDQYLFNIQSISYGERMNRTLTPTSHPVGYGWTVGNYAGDVLKIVLPQEQWMEFVKTQPNGYAVIVRNITLTYMSRNSRTSDEVQFIECMLGSNSTSSSGDQTGATMREIEFMYKYQITNGVSFVPLDNDNFVTTTFVTLR